MTGQIPLHYRWRVHAPQLALFLIVAATMSSSGGEDHSCHAFPFKTFPWNSKLYASQATNRQGGIEIASISLPAITTSNLANEDAAAATVPVTLSPINGSNNNNNNNIGLDDDIHLKTSEVLSLDSIRASLIRQEETIIFALIERAQFRQNLVVYQNGGLGHLGTPPGSKKMDENDEGNTKEELSFLEYMLMGTEALHFAVRRYTSPEEHAFFPERLPTSNKVLEELVFPSLLSEVGDASSVNFNEILLKKYITEVVQAICQPGDDEQHGSTALCDVNVLQALSKRVHYGKFVAESKYMADPEEYQRLVDAGDADGVMKLLTNETVEAKVLRRARLKAATYGTEPLLVNLPPLEAGGEKATIVAAAAASAVVAAIEAMGDDGKDGAGSKVKNKVCPSTVENIYRDLIIPLTKDIEVAYLFRRCGKEPPPEYAPHRMSTDPL